MVNGTIRVGISMLSPFVIKTNYRYSGFEIDLWKEITNRLNIKYEYVRAPFDELMESMEQGKYDVAFSGITINDDREHKFYFSRSYLNSGLLILSRKKPQKSVFTFIMNNFAKELLIIILFFLSIIIVFINIVWFLNRNNGIIDSYYPAGIIQSISYTIALISTGGFSDLTPRQYTGKIFIISVIAISIFTIIWHITKIVIAIKKRNNKTFEFQELIDLKDVRVATEKDSTSEKLLKANNIKPIIYDKIETAFKKLSNNSVDAILYDALPIFYFLKNTKGEFKISSKLFENQQYAIAINPNSGLRQQIDNQILDMKEDGFFDFLYKKWFGDN